jgi:hypothetical protein
MPTHMKEHKSEKFMWYNNSTNLQIIRKSEVVTKTLLTRV